MLNHTNDNTSLKYLRENDLVYVYCYSKANTCAINVQYICTQAFIHLIVLRI